MASTRRSILYLLTSSPLYLFTFRINLTLHPPRLYTLPALSLTLHSSPPSSAPASFGVSFRAMTRLANTLKHPAQPQRLCRSQGARCERPPRERRVAVRRQVALSAVCGVRRQRRRPRLSRTASYYWGRRGLIHDEIGAVEARPPALCGTGGIGDGWWFGRCTRDLEMFCLCRYLADPRGSSMP